MRLPCLVCKELGDNQGAFNDYSQAINLGTSYAADAYTKRGLTRYLMKDWLGAISDLNQAIELNSGSYAYALRATCRDRLEDLPGAIIEDCNQAIKLDPNSALAYGQRGASRLKVKDYQRAIADLTKAIELGPNHSSVYLNRGKCYGILGNTQEAIADFTKCIQMNPEYKVEVYFVRATVRYKSGDLQGTIVDLTHTIELDPNHANAYYVRSDQLYNLGDKQGAVNDLTQYLRLNPNNAEAYDLRGVRRYQLGDKQGSIGDFQQAAVLYIQQGDYTEYLNEVELIAKIEKELANA